MEKRLKKDKDKKQEQQKLPLRRVIQNNLFMLGMIHGVDPWLIPLRLGMSLFVSVTYFLGSTYLLQYVMNAIGEGKGFFEIFITFFIPDSNFFNGKRKIGMAFKIMPVKK